MLNTRTKSYKGIAMEGLIATWYARNTRKDIRAFQRVAETIAGQIADTGRVLEIAPGPGYLAIELARLGAFSITGVDISQAFVRIASANAARTGVDVDFRHGDAQALPFGPASFDFIVCRAAFKNFTDPVRALREMRRVLKPGGQALIVDLRRDASDADIDRYVDGMGSGRVNAIMTKFIFRRILRKNAYSEDDFLRMAAEAGFEGCEIKDDSIGFEVWLRHDPPKL